MGYTRQKRRGPRLRAVLQSFVTANDSRAQASHRPCCCRTEESSRPRRIRVLCCRDLPRATAFYLSANGTAPALLPARAQDASRPADGCDKSLSAPAEHIPDKELPESSCCRNRCPAFRRQNSSHLSPPCRTARNPSAEFFPIDKAWAPWQPPPKPVPERHTAST